MKKTDAYGTVKNLNMKSNSREARSGLNKVRDEATIERVRQDLTTHQKGALGKVLILSRRILRRILRIDLEANGTYNRNVYTLCELHKMEN